MLYARPESIFKNLDISSRIFYTLVIIELFLTHVHINSFVKLFDF